MTTATKATRQKSKAKSKPDSELVNELKLQFPPYLKEFRKMCVSNFDLHWICSTLLAETTAHWFRKILTLMLVGWALRPNDKQVRVSLAWHEINTQIHKQTCKKRKNKLLSYYMLSFGEFLFKAERYQKIYLPLGGFNSKEKYSVRELRSLLSQSAKEAQNCLPLIDILAFQNSDLAKRKSRKPSFGYAEKQLQVIKDICDDMSSNVDEHRHVNSNDIYTNLFHPNNDLRLGLSINNFQKHWKTYVHTYEIIAALQCMTRPTKKTATKPGTALKTLSKGRIYALPYQVREFQQELIARAKFFEGLLNSRRGHEDKPRIPETVQIHPSVPQIFSPDALQATLEKLEDHKPPGRQRRG